MSGKVMGTVQDHIATWIHEYPPDRFKWCTNTHEFIEGCALQYGPLGISIQWGRYHYGDNYVLNNGYFNTPTPEHYPPRRSYTAEVAMFFNGRYQYIGKHLHTHMVRMPFGDMVYPYAEIPAIAVIVRDAYRYANRDKEDTTP